MQSPQLGLFRAGFPDLDFPQTFNSVGFEVTLTEWVLMLTDEFFTKNAHLTTVVKFTNNVN